MAPLLDDLRCSSSEPAELQQAVSDIVRLGVTAVVSAFGVPSDITRDNLSSAPVIIGNALRRAPHVEVVPLNSSRLAL